jgi:hypothetical protein
MPHAAIGTEIHQPLDIHRNLPSQVALDGVVAINHFADAQYLIIGQLMDPPFERNPHPTAYFERLGAPDAMDVGEANRNQLLIGNINASDPRHLRFSLTRSEMGV